MTLSVNNAPHAHDRNSTASLMLDVLTALTPTAIAGIWLFGWSAARVILFSVIFCVGLEYIWQKITKKPVRIGDLSAAVTGMILAMNLPSTAPWWLILIAAALAIILVKQMFGGIGCNFVNPALAARAVLLTSWPGLMNASNSSASAYMRPFDVVTSATVLTKGSPIADTPMIDLLIGRIPGTIGEVCKIAILIGFVYLLVRKTITWHIPVVMVVSFMVFGKLFGIENILSAALSGSLLFGAVFMATDYVTSPVTTIGQVIYAAGAGLIIALIRCFGGYPEGTTYAILLMNVVTPLIDRSIHPRIYGTVKQKKEGKANA